MEFEAFLKYHLVLTQQEYVEISDDFNDNGIIPSFVLRLNNTQDALSLINFLMVENPIAVNYTVTVDAQHEAKFSREWLSALVPLIAHVNYFKCDSKHLVLLKSKDQNSTLLSELKNEFGRIGFNDIAFNNLLGAEAKVKTCNVLYFDDLPNNDGSVWPLVYERLFYLNSPLNIAVNFFSTTGLKNIKPEIDKKLSLLDEKIKMLITRLFKAENLKNHLVENSRKLEQQNTSKQAYLDFILNETVNSTGDFNQQLNEALKIRKFYYHEYEILPLWYKRLGHIIKVLIGKRSLKSLFNDNVKKYKD